MMKSHLSTTSLWALSGLAIACSTSETLDPTPLPPAVRPDHVINEQMEHSTAYLDEPFDAPVVTYFRTIAELPDLDVRRLAVIGGRVYAGTASLLVRLADGGAAFEPAAPPQPGGVVDLSVLAPDRPLVAFATEVHALTAAGGAGDIWPVTGIVVTAVASHGSTVFAGTDQGLQTVDATGALPVAAAQGFAVRDLVVVGDVVWIATPAGVQRYDVAADAMLATLTAPDHLVDDDVRALAASGDGGLVLAATAGGLAHIDGGGGSAKLVAPGLESLPNGDLRAVTEAGGEVLTGHAIGATAMTASNKDHYHSLRWILAEEVAAVALEADGTRWIGTAAGITRIGVEEQTLLVKAERSELRNDLHWRMDGFVADGANFDSEWDQTKPPFLGDNDNDGLWSQMQIGAWCLAYAHTGDEAFYDKARKAMDVIQLQFDVPAATFTAQGFESGFITRSLVRSDETVLFEDKSTQDNWHLQEHLGETYYWKDDTSSDEYAGHFFGIPLFYDLCAKTDEEKKALADRAALAATYIIDGEYQLIDLDGEPTTHGRWDGLANAVDDIGECLAAGKIRCGESYGGGGWLNSIEILGLLLSTWHMTGDDKFYDAYERLYVTERYGEMIPLKETTFTVTSRSIANHSDHELASLAYFTLLRYEPNPERRAVVIKSILDLWEWERPERNALEVAVMSSAVDAVEASFGAQTLREMPLDWREWLYDNAHRKDAELDVKDRHDDEQFKVVFPYDEIRTMKWNGNPYAVSGGGNGMSTQAPWPYLLPYWMMRYYGAIE